ncbi:hypothetical protein GCM10011363_16110 [Marivita lacus]|uniref:histidine kinase n=1 Tax=Marivita lacus TaxID=1323742 RepID=A0ABQ1KLX7_9RHOB|nr:PAS domain-containing protein [Marivita lacus]GGC00279.1 hypothetical protein GCM10011363_16110 [Marivita lacus]
MIPHSLYEREKQVRLEAEALLEAKKQEISEMNHRLMAEAESVRAALADTEAARLRESAVLKERSILSEALKALTGKSGADEAMQCLLTVLRREIGGRDCFFVQAEGDHTVIAASADSAHVGHALPLPAAMIDRPRRMARITSLLAGYSWPGGTECLASMLIVPLEIGNEKAGAFVLACLQSACYSAGDLRTLEQVARLAAQALLALREARRNALLVALVEGKSLETSEAVLDAPLEAVHRAFSRLTDMQGQVVGILDNLLGASLQDADAAIDTALARMGELTESDRVYVYRLRSSGDFIDNTHLWCAPDVAPALEIPKEYPAHMFDNVRASFDAGKEVLISDVSAMPDDAPEKQLLRDHGVRSHLTVPMVENGALRALVSFDSIRTQRNYLPGEVHLIRSVAKVILSVLARRDAEEKLVQANAEALSQQKRLKAVLSAMPDLIVELDRDGRLVSLHSASVVVPDGVFEAAFNRTPEERLSPEYAKGLRDLMAELDAGAQVVRSTFEMSITAPTRQWWQMTASAIGDQGYVLAMRDITEAREKSLEIERLSEIARRTTNLVVLTDAERRIEWVNDAFVDTTGWTLEDVKGKKPGEFLQSEGTDPQTVTAIRDALDNEKAVQVEILNRSRTGREYWLSLDIHPLHDAAGELEGFLALEVDITDKRKQAESLRRAAAEAALARANLEKAVEALQDGFVLYDADDCLVICNSRFREIYALSEPALVTGASFESIVRYGLAVGEYPSAIGREEEFLAERLRQHAQPDRETEQKLSDGTWLRVFEKSMPDGGRVELRVDITELKLAERRALADKAAAMAASRDGIAITDHKGLFNYTNRAHLEMFGYASEKELLGQSWSMLYGPEEAEWMEANVMPAVMRDGGWSGEIVGLAKYGAPVYQDVSLTLKDDGGLLCITRDISVRNRERAERDRLLNELQLAQRREIIGQIAAGLAHDFNNLLAIISGGASLIVEQAEDRGAEAVGASRILAASDQAAGLVKRLLTLGARQSARIDLDMRRPVQEAAELVRSSLRVPMRLALNLPDTPVDAQADPTDVLQLLLNLAINARDAMASQSGTISIRLVAAEEPAPTDPIVVGRINPARRYARLTVEDNGPGMPPEVAAKILTPYYSTKGEMGTGLGLAVVSSVIEDNGGAMSLTTEPGKGTRFDVYWPVSAGQEAAVASVPNDELTGRLDGRMILVVDDQPEVLDVITAYLEAAGAEVAATTYPADVLEALRDDPTHWDLLVTDFDMPDMDGADLAEAAKNIVPDLPIILVTALAREAGRTGPLFTGVLSKPIDRKSLVLQCEMSLLRSESDQKD